MHPDWLLTIYCLAVIVASVAGGQLSLWLRMTHLRTQMLMSCVGGLMLGMALLHLLPHAAAELGSTSNMGFGALVGLIVMFLLIRLFHTHDHAVSVDIGSDIAACTHPSHDHVHRAHDHGHSLAPSSNSLPLLVERTASATEHASHSRSRRGIGWFGLFVGLTLHSFVDGIALAAGLLADMQHGAWLDLAGLGIFLAVFLHKPLDAFTFTWIMGRQRWSPVGQTIANLLFAAACPLGAALFYFGATQLSGSSAWLGWGLAISAGFFIGIALADLLPEVAFHDHDRGKLTAALLLGVAIAVGVENLPGHTHEHLAPPNEHEPATK